MLRFLTQKQANKMFPERGYDGYDPMLLLIGDRHEIGLVQEHLISPCNKNTSLDVGRKLDSRLVIWKED